MFTLNSVQVLAETIFFTRPSRGPPNFSLNDFIG